MSAPGFWRSVAYGLVVSAIGTVAFTALAKLVGLPLAARVVATGLGLAVVVHGLAGGIRTGRLVSVAAWVVLTGALWAFDPRLWLWLATQVGFAWLVRSLYRYDTLRGAAIDGCISAVALGSAIAALEHTHSAFLALWTYFLLLALVALIPRDATPAPDDPADDERFDAARRTAEAALRRLADPS